MWAKAGSEEKIVAAKRVVKEWLKDAKLSSDSQIGLTAYGHRDKDDCKDIERFPSVSYDKRSSLTPIVDKLSPKGKTPIADSLQTVGESLKSYEGATSILLVSDGIESCGKDPCAVAHQLREQYGVNVTIHVVGFDVGDGRPQLECIAREGGGKYYNVSDAKELSTAFEDVKAELIKADSGTKTPPPPSAEKTVKVVKLPGVGKISVPNLGGSEFVWICRQDDKNCDANLGNLQSGVSALTAPAGTYKLKFGNFFMENIEVTGGQTTTPPVGKISVPNLGGTEFVWICRQDDKNCDANLGNLQSGVSALTVPVGIYKLKFGNQFLENITVEAGQKVVLEH
jgi:hypothetical protein